MPERTHTCPGGCGHEVPNRLFACPVDWARLPRDLQRPITATARLNLLEPRRIDAVATAVRWFAENTAAGVR